MSKLMSVLGIVLLAIGAALALVGLVNPAQMQIYGLTLDTAAILLTGGILSIGLGGVISALQGYVPAVVATPVLDTISESVPMVERPVFKTETPVAAVVEEPAAPVEEPPARVRFPGFGRKTAAVAATAAVVTEAIPEVAAAPTKSAVDDTIAALEQAKADIANAIGSVSDITEPSAEAPVEAAVEEDVADDDEEPVDGELYVIEEREIRGRPARILSDQTVEAETDEGWMRFENLEHLNEYLDSMGEPA
jgi:hypothetical protein